MSARDRVKELQITFGLTNQETADMLGVSRRTLLAWYSEHRNCPNPIGKLAQCILERERMKT